LNKVTHVQQGNSRAIAKGTEKLGNICSAYKIDLDGGLQSGRRAIHRSYVSSVVAVVVSTTSGKPWVSLGDFLEVVAQPIGATTTWHHYNEN
jgi:hypothetical protein